MAFTALNAEHASTKTPNSAISGGTRVDKNKVAANEAMAEAEAHQMDGTKEEEQEAQYVVNEIENASADIIMDIVNH